MYTFFYKRVHVTSIAVVHISVVLESCIYTTCEIYRRVVRRRKKELRDEVVVSNLCGRSFLCPAHCLFAGGESV